MSLRGHMHINLNIRALGFHRAGWRHPSVDPHRVEDISFYINLAQLAESGGMDAVFLADGPVLNTPHPSRAPIDHPLEPFTILAAIAAHTHNIGLIGTTSTTYSDLPVIAARVAWLDHVSDGRAGVNFVTSSGQATARNFGYDEHPDHANRYARATEFVQLAKALWDSAAAGKPPPFRHARDYFDLDLEFDIPPSPQGRPVIVQAGQSEQGRNLCASEAEMVYCGSSSLENGCDFYADIKRRARSVGRDPDHVRILPGVIPIIGSTECEARAFEAELEELAYEASDPIALLSERLEIDFSLYDPDGPLPFDDLPTEAQFRGGVSAQLRLVKWAHEENLSIRQFARKALSRLSAVQWTLVGTPEQIAGEMEDWFRQGAADGFNILPPVNPRGSREFIEHVMPVLRQKGLVRREYEGSTLRENLGFVRRNLDGPSADQHRNRRED